MLEYSPSGSASTASRSIKDVVSHVSFIFGLQPARVLRRLGPGRHTEQLVDNSPPHYGRHDGTRDNAIMGSADLRFWTETTRRE